MNIDEFLNSFLNSEECPIIIDGADVTFKESGDTHTGHFYIICIDDKVWFVPEIYDAGNPHEAIDSAIQYCGELGIRDAVFKVYSVTHPLITPTIVEVTDIRPIYHGKKTYIFPE